MKKYLLMAVVLVIVVLYSCEKNAIIYSCDEEINAWVSDNLEEITTMTRNEWKQLDSSYKIPAYRAFTQSQRVSFWKDKISGVMSLYAADSNEYSHLGCLLDFVINNQDIFDFSVDYTDEQIEKIEVFGYIWVEKAIEELGWSVEYVRSIVASGDDISLTNTPGGDSSPDCNCSMESWIDWCVGSHCESANCDSTAHGCSLLLVGSCDGGCGGYV